MDLPEHDPATIFQSFAGQFWGDGPITQMILYQLIESRTLKNHIFN